MRLIDADKLFGDDMTYRGKPMKLKEPFITSRKELKSYIDVQPTAGNAARGEWQEHDIMLNGVTRSKDVRCSMCGEHNGCKAYRFCPWCGAEMG